MDLIAQVLGTQRSETWEGGGVGKGGAEQTDAGRDRRLQTFFTSPFVRCSLSFFPCNSTAAAAALILARLGPSCKVDPSRPQDSEQACFSISENPRYIIAPALKNRIARPTCIRIRLPPLVPPRSPQSGYPSSAAAALCCTRDCMSSESS